METKKAVLKRTLAVFMAILMIISTFGSSFAFAYTTDADVVDSGHCGFWEDEEVYWTEYDDGTLVISGNGMMKSYENSGGSDVAPWFETALDEEEMDYFKVPDSDIKKVIIEEGVTCVGYNAFSYCEALEEIVISSSVYSIAEDAFAFCPALKKIDVSNEQYYIDPYGVLISRAYDTCCEEDEEECSFETIELFPGGLDLDEYEIHEDIDAVGVYAFSGCQNLESIRVPGEGVRIETYAESGSVSKIYGTYGSPFYFYADSKDIDFFSLDGATPVSAEITKLPYVLEYELNSTEISIMGLEITLTLTDDSEVVCSEFPYYSVESDFNEVGESEVTVLFEDFRLEYTVNVFDKRNLTAGEEFSFTSVYNIPQNFYFEAHRDGEHIVALNYEDEDWGDFCVYKLVDEETNDWQTTEDLWYSNEEHEFTVDLEAGEKYYFSVSSYNEENVTDMTILVTEPCLHENTTETEAVEAACDAPGYTAGVYCEDCEKYISGHEKITVPHEDEDEDGYCDVCENLMSDISVDETKTVIISEEDEIVYLKFTPVSSGYYTFYADSIDGDTCGYIYDENKEELAYSDDDRYGWNENSLDFCLVYYLEAATTYYWGASYLGGTIGSFNVTLIEGYPDGYEEDEEDDDDYWEEEYVYNDDFRAYIGEDGMTCTIDHIYNCSSTIDIPEEIEGYTVRGIDVEYWGIDREVEVINIPSTVAEVSYLASSYYLDNLREINVDPENEYLESRDGILYSIYDGEATMIYCPMKYTGIVNIASDVAYIDEFALAGANEVTGFNISDANISYLYNGGVLYDYDETTIIRAVDPNAEFVVSDRIENMYSFAFAGNSELEKITINSGITDVVYYAFNGCENLKEVILPDGITSIGAAAFENCTSLKTVDLGDDLTYIDQWAFRYSGIEEIVLPDSLEEMSFSVFYECSSLKDVTLGTGLTYIPVSTFAFCESLEEITIPDNIIVISSVAFTNSGLKSIVIPDSVETIGSYAFDECDLESVYIGKGVQEMVSAFQKCANLKTLEFAEGFNGNFDYAFIGCKALEDIDLPSTVQNISYSAFRGASALKKVDLPDNLQSVEGRAFMETGWEADHPNGDMYIEYVLYNYKGDMPANYKLFVKKGTRVIADFAHSDQNNLIEVKITDGTEYIGNWAFAKCPNLKTVYIPDTVKSIDYMAFSQSGVENVYYEGSQQQWNQIENSGDFEGATIHFDSTYDQSEPTTKPATTKPTTTKPTTTKPTITKPATTKPVITKPSPTKPVATKPSAPSGLKAESVKTNEITVTWNAVNGASSYVLYYSTDGKKWTSVKSSKTSATVKKLKSATKYQFKVVAVSAAGNSADSSILSAATKPAKVTLSTVKSSKKKTVVVTWKKVSNVSGYQVTYSTSKKFTKKTTKNVTVKKSKTTKTTIKKLKSKKKYFVKVRAYKTVGSKKIYGAYSKTKTVKVK